MKTISSRLIFFTSLFCLVLIAAAQTQKPPSQAILVMGGDVQWSLTLRPATVLFGNDEPPDENWRPSPYLNAGPSKAEYEQLGDKPKAPNHDDIAIRYGLHFSSDEEMLRYPFQKLVPTLRAADFVFFNLETPLSDTAPMMGEARTPEQFAAALRWAGASVVTIANNHTFDTEQQGFLDTMRSLSRAGLPYIGGGRNLDEARKPVILEHQGIKIGFIGYAQFSNMGEPAFAAENRPGIAPMDPLLIKEDIVKLRPLVDYVAVSIHWGNDKSANVSPANRKLAHQLIDAGADIILGHHTPFPKGIEVYKGKVIVYSPAHVFIGHNHPEWGNDYLLRFTLGPHAVEKIEVLPIAGVGKLLAQPFLLQGEEAHDLLEKVRVRTAALDTELKIDGDLGVILPQSHSLP
jgi:hypothetical protein